MELPAQTIEQLLDRWPVARLASVGPDGRPHQVPVVFARDGELLWSPVDAKPKRGGELVRVANLRARPAASLLLDAYEERWERLWWLRVDVTARVVAGSEFSSTPGVAEALAALCAKYPQYARVPVLRDPPTLLAFTPFRLASWCASRDAARMLEAETG